MDTERNPKARCPRPGCGHPREEHDQDDGPCNHRVMHPNRTHCICYQFGEWVPGTPSIYDPRQRG